MIKVRRLIPDNHNENTCFNCGVSDRVILQYGIEIITKGHGNYMRLCDICIRRLGAEIMADVLWNVDREEAIEWSTRNVLTAANPCGGGNM